MKNVTTLKGVKNIEVLQKNFDNVILETFDSYQTLELSNNVNKNGIEKVVYLKLNIALEGSGRRSSKECLDGAIASLLPWIDLLIDCDEKKSTSTSSTSLFDMDDNFEIPVDTNRDLSDTKKIENLKKKYKFFDLFDPLTWWWTFHSIDYKKFIPTNSEITELVKQAILKYKDIGGRHDDAWFDSPSYVTRNGNLSDIELFKRVMSTLRIYVSKWQIHNGCLIDDSYTLIRDKQSKTSYLYYFDGERLFLNYSNIKNYINASNKKMFNSLRDEIETYDLFNDEFVAFLRECFDVKKSEPLDDNGAKKILLESFANSVNSSWQSILDNSKTYKEFKTKLFHNVDTDTIEMSYKTPTEDYNFVMNLEKNTPHLQITQRTSTRQRLGYTIDSSDYDCWKYIVEFLDGDEVFIQIFNLFKNKSIKNKEIIQTSLFDFLGAA